MTEREQSSAQKEFACRQLAGLGVAGYGLAHFARPQMFDSFTRQAFPRNTRQHIYINGGIETALGLGLAVPKTRKLALSVRSATALIWRAMSRVIGSGPTASDRLDAPLWRNWRRILVAHQPAQIDYQ